MRAARERGYRVNETRSSDYAIRPDDVAGTERFRAGLRQIAHDTGRTLDSITDEARKCLDELRTGHSEAIYRRWIESGRNATYTLHPATQGLLLSRRHPGRVLCLEARRDLLGAPWQPFAPTRVGPRKALRLARLRPAASLSSR